MRSCGRRRSSASRRSDPDPPPAVLEQPGAIFGNREGEIPRACVAELTPRSYRGVMTSFSVSPEALRAGAATAESVAAESVALETGTVDAGHPVAATAIALFTAAAQTGLEERGHSIAAVASGLRRSADVYRGGDLDTAARTEAE